MINVRFTNETENWVVKDYINDDDAETCAFSAVHVNDTAIKAEVIIDGCVTKTYGLDDGF